MMNIKNQKTVRDIPGKLAAAFDGIMDEINLVIQNACNASPEKEIKAAKRVAEAYVADLWQPEFLEKFGDSDKK